jgi:hypothetical protein
LLTNNLRLVFSFVSILYFILLFTKLRFVAKQELRVLNVVGKAYAELTYSLFAHYVNQGDQPPDRTTLFFFHLRQSRKNPPPIIAALRQ